MLKTIGNMGFFLRLRSRIFACMRNDQLEPSLRDRIRPFIFGGYACWFDRSDAA